MIRPPTNAKLPDATLATAPDLAVPEAAAAVDAAEDPAALVGVGVTTVKTVLAPVALAVVFAYGTDALVELTEVGRRVGATLEMMLVVLRAELEMVLATEVVFAVTARAFKVAEDDSLVEVIEATDEVEATEEDEEEDEAVMWNGLEYWKVVGALSRVNLKP